MGLDFVTIQDHPYQARFLDTWTLLTQIAAQTSSLRVAPNVFNLPLRPPVVLARSVASLDLLSNGRVELGGRFGASAGFLAGSPTDWAEQLAELTLAEGMSTYFLGTDDPDTIQRFAAEVVPAARDLVAAGRSVVATGGPVRVTTTEPISDRIRPGPFTVVPTPDDGVRRSSERPWDEALRPTGPSLDPAQRYSAQQQATGQHLVDVHNSLRAELTQLHDVIAQVARGALDAGRARSLINTMTMRQNNWTLGAFCESYCRIGTGHHSLEDASVFPHLRRADPRLVPVLDRLHDEHEVIAEVLERVDLALVAMVTTPDGLRQLQDAVDLLSDTLLSHLSYEERELVEPLARVGFY